MLSMQIISEIRKITGTKINPRVMVLNTLEHIASISLFQQEGSDENTLEKNKNENSSRIKSLFKKIFK